MTILLQNAKVIDDLSKHHNTTVDIRISNGLITNIGSLTPLPDEQCIALDNLHVSPGWFDSSVCFGEPGYEEREGIKNGLKVAAKGGFTGVALNPDTNPHLDSSSDVAFVKSKAQTAVTELFPIGTLTQNAKGEHLASLYDMQQAGAVAYGDYKLAITNANLLKVALQYTQGFDALVLSYPEEPLISGKGIVNEGEVSTQLGLKGIPSISESLQVARDLHLLEYTGGKLHIPTISCAASVALIKAAKNKGLNVTTSVAIHNLMLTDSVLTDFDTIYKLKPPLRTELDRQALIEGVKEGTIDMVTSDHCPLTIEDKKVEFDYAAYGSIGLESTFNALLTLFDTHLAVKLLTAGRDRFCDTNHTIDQGATANLTLFSPEGCISFRESRYTSLNANNALINQKGKGTIYGIIVANKTTLDV